MGLLEIKKDILDKIHFKKISFFLSVFRCYLFLMFLAIFILFPTNVFSQKKTDSLITLKKINFKKVQQNARLIAVDTLKNRILLNHKTKKSAIIYVDSATSILANTKKISLKNLKVGLIVTVEYREYADNKKIANKIVQIVKDSSSKKQSEKTAKPTKKVIPKNSKYSKVIETGKNLMENKLTGKSREQLYKDIFNTSPPKRSNKVKAVLVINEKVNGSLELKFSDDRQNFSIPAKSVIRLMTNLVTPDFLIKIKDAVDSTGRITKIILIKLGLQVNFDSKKYQLQIIVPTILLIKQLHQLNGGLKEDPYSVESIKPNDFSAYLNIQANQQYRYFQNLTIDSSLSIVENQNKQIRQPFFGYFDGVLNVKNMVLEGAAKFQENNSTMLQRSDVRFVFDLPKSAIRFLAGDIRYATFGYQSNIHIGGISIAKDFSLQPYKLTYGVSEYEFHLTDASMAEVWVNDILIRKMELQPGTHNIQDFPFSLGDNNVKIILKDYFGRIETKEFSVLYQPSLLIKDKFQYSCNLGLPARLERGSYIYSKSIPSFSFSYRRGILNNLTVQSYAQGFFRDIDREDSISQATLKMGMLGFGGLYAIPSGILTLNAATTYNKDIGLDFAAKLGYTYQTKVNYNRTKKKDSNHIRLNNPISWNAQAEYLGPKFLKNPYNLNYYFIEKLKFSSNLRIPLANRLSINIGGMHYLRRDTTNLINFSLRLQKTWIRNLRVGLTFQYTTDTKGQQTNPAIMANLNWTMRSDNNSFSVSEGINKIKPDTTGKQWNFNTGLDWNYEDYSGQPEKVRASANIQFGEYVNDYNARVGFNGNQGSLEFLQAMVEPKGTGLSYLQHKSDFSLKTALVYVDKKLCFSRPIYNGFAMVKGIKNLEKTNIKVNPTSQGYDAITTLFGPAIIPLYAPYQLKHLKVQPLNPPMGFVDEKSTFTLFPKYKSGFSLNIGTENTMVIIGTLLDYDDKSFAHKKITINTTNENKTEPIRTFTNAKGRFQFLGHSNETYEITVTSFKRQAIIFKVPKGNKDFFRIGTLTFKK